MLCDELVKLARETGLGDEDIVSCMADAVEEAKKSESSGSHAKDDGKASDSKSGGGKASSSSKGAVPVLEKKGYLLAEARAFMPKCRGCRLATHTDRAWEAKYPTPRSPHSHSKSFLPGDVDSSFVALQECLKWTWEAHYAATGAKSPWEFGIVYESIVRDTAA